MNLIRGFELVSAMADVSRYSMVRMVFQESVLEHSGFVVFFCYLIALEINVKAGSPIDISSVLARAIMHDVEETVTGDIPRPTKYATPEIREMIRKIEDSGTRKKMADLGLSEMVKTAALSERDRSKTGREGFVVSLVDTLAVVYKSWDEVLLRGNLSMVKVAASTLPDLDEQERLTAELFSGEDEVVSFLLGIIADARKIVEEATSREKRT
jgi:5'-deoxynucleotidase YfbR-like HD superfamily hydrolase